MTNSGWTADPAALLRFQVPAILATGETDGVEVAHALGSSPAEVGDVFQFLVDRDLATTFTRRAGAMYPEDATLTAMGRALVSERDAARTPSGIKRACIAAMLNWLEAHDGVPLSSSDDFGSDVRAHFYGQPFDVDVRRAVERDLRDLGLMDGTPTWGGPVLRPSITMLGRVVSTRHAGDLISWQAESAGGGTTINVAGSTGVVVANNSPGAQQSVQVTTDVREQILNLAAALDQMTPALGLEPADIASAAGLAGQLREAADHVQSDPGRVHRLIETLKAIAVNGTGSAAGTALIALAEQIARNI